MMALSDLSGHAANVRSQGYSGPRYCARPGPLDPKPTRAAEQGRAAKTRRLLPAETYDTF